MNHEKKNKRSKQSLLRNVTPVNMDNLIVPVREDYRVLALRNLTESTYVLRFTRNNMKFVPGQHIVVGITGDNQTREYSIYSTPDQEYLEVIIKEVEDGLVSGKLRGLKPNEIISVDGPFGFFTIDEKLIPYRKFLFIATGTGIAPFHSMTGSFPDLDYNILHGVRYSNEAYESSFYPSGRYTVCTSRDSGGDFQGRVTDYLLSNEVDSDTLVYLCGNCDMIYEVYDLLTSRGLDSDQIKTEVYF
jgi:ferredoxin--NADP+ reductase/benzoate/toluate 1,2-dioxygenase reductase subunit